MTPIFTINLLRVLFIILACFIGSALGEGILGSYLAGAMIGAAFGLVVVLVDRLLKGVSLSIFSSATFGLLLGFLFAQLLLVSSVLKYQSEEMQWLISLVVYMTFAYLGMMLAIRSHRDEFCFIIPFVRFRRESLFERPLVVDTNICIDGRILELCRTGFISTSIVIGRVVLSELQTLADSSDPLRRGRGRRGLDTLKALQEMREISVTIHEGELDGSNTVDNRLIQLAQLIGGALLTNDTNLGKIARLQNVEVLLLHDLELALRRSVNAGDEMPLPLVKEGREPHQAVGYLPDGTMIIVNHARQHVGETVSIRVTSTVQTTAGRLVFADLAE